MTIEIRPLRADEMAQLGELGAYVYGGSFGDGPDNLIAEANAPEWTLCALENGKLISSFTAIPFTMRANGNATPLAGVSTVGTLPEYRRQGWVRKIHTQAFADMRDNGQTMAALWASQAAIYQRYGYAMTTVLRSYRIDTADIGFFDGDNGSGNVERTDVEGGYDTIKRLYIEFIADRTCYLHRAKALWLNNALDQGSAAGPIQIAISRDAAGQPNGYLVYTLRFGKVDHRARSQEIVIRDLVWSDQDAYRSLWSWIARHDLAGRVVWANAPADDPAFELFVEPRMLHQQDNEGAWFRVVDVQPALAARGYDADGEISIHIGADDIAPWNAGTVKLEVSSEGAHATKSSADADLTMSIKTLASLYTGRYPASVLAGWGLIEGERRALQRADELFRTRHAPHSPDHF